MANPSRIVFLYTELAGYFMACVNELSKQYKGEIHILRWPVNNEAPFEFGNANSPNIILYNRKDFNDEQLLELMNKIQPQLIYCSGWIDKGYVKVCKQWKNKINVIGGIDTQWNGSFKQYIRVITSAFTIRKYFSHVWAAGEVQKKYALKLGFKKANVFTGVYSADLNYFNLIYNRTIEGKVKDFPKRFIYAGRYLEFKGIVDLWEAFIQSVNETGHEWELICLGTGDLWKERVQHPRIKHLGFKQPHELEAIMAQSGIFILPSRFEPWAVALHEFCAAGFPVICSNKVGAAEAFLAQNQNGFIFEAGNVKAIKEQLIQATRLSQDQLISMSKHSHSLAQKINPQGWAKQILDLL